jgi:restriction system protein
LPGSLAARKAATVTTPTVNLIDGNKLCDLVRDQQISLRIVAQVDEGWSDA